MNVIIPIIALYSSLAFSVAPGHCPSKHKNKVMNLSKKLCQDHLQEFAMRSNASCKISKHEMNDCFGECLDEGQNKLAEVRVDMSSDCGREHVYYNRTNIKYYR